MQGGGEKRKLFSEKTEKTQRKRKRKEICSLFWSYPYRKGENFSLRKLRNLEKKKKKGSAAFLLHLGETVLSEFQVRGS
jgi:hypothetical protein